MSFYFNTRTMCSPRLSSIGAKHGAAAQQRATLLWLAILGVNAEHDCGGKIPAIYVESFPTLAPLLTPLEVHAALEQLSVAELVELAQGGAVNIAPSEAGNCSKQPTE